MVLSFEIGPKPVLVTSDQCVCWYTHRISQICSSFTSGEKCVLRLFPVTMCESSFSSFSCLGAFPFSSPHPRQSIVVCREMTLFHGSRVSSQNHQTQWIVDSLGKCQTYRSGLGKPLQLSCSQLAISLLWRSSQCSTYGVIIWIDFGRKHLLGFPAVDGCDILHQLKTVVDRHDLPRCS